MKNYKKIAGVVLLLFLLAWFFYYLKMHISDFKQISIINPVYLIPLFLVSLTLFFTNGLIIKYLLLPFNVRLSFKEWFGLSVIASLYNTITPFKSGSIVRATYLKKRHTFPYTDFLAISSITYLFNFIIAGFFGILSILVVYLKYRIFNFVILLVFICFLMPMLIVFFLPIFKERNSWLVNKLIRLINGWHLIKKDRKICYTVLLTIGAQVFIATIGVIFSYNVLGINIGFTKSMFLVSISYLVGIISLTPAGLGVLEASQVFSALLIGITPAQSITATLLGRIVAIPIMFIFGPLFSYALLKEVMQKK